VVIQYVQWMVGNGAEPRRTQGGVTRGSCEMCTRDSDEKIQIRWRLRILKFKKSVYVWFDSKVELYMIH